MFVIRFMCSFGGSLALFKEDGGVERKDSSDL